MRNLFVLIALLAAAVAPPAFAQEQKVPLVDASSKGIAIPQYGGYCAFGMSQGHAVPVDPEAWKIVDGKLYLNYNKDIQKEWFKDIPGHIHEANENWPKLHQ